VRARICRECGRFAGNLRASCGLAVFGDFRGLWVNPVSIVTRADYGDRPLRRQPDALSTGNQEAVIRAWLVLIKEIDEAIAADVLAPCRLDEDARKYFIGRAGESVTADADDRRTCTQCADRRSSVCVVAKPGGQVSGIGGYRPATGIRQRCPAFKPANPLANSM
jgi:hypothetical protein